MKSYLFSIVILIYFFSSCTQDKSRNTDCQLDLTGKDSVEFVFGDTTAYDIRFSRIDRNKVWISLVKGNTVLEIDLSNSHCDTLPLEYRRMLSDYAPVCRDSYDSLIWIGGMNSSLQTYNQKTYKLNELPLKNVTHIIPRKDRVYLVAFYGFYYYDRSTGGILKDPSVPLDMIQQTQLLDDETIWLDRKYTYNFADGTFQNGLHYDGEDFSLYYLLGTDKGISLLSKGVTLKIKTKGQESRIISNTGFPYSHSYYVDSPYVWLPYNDCNIHTYDINSAEIRKYWYRLPEVNNYSRSYIVEKDFIWIFRPEQLYFIRTTDGKLFRYPAAASEGFIRLITDQCNIYLLYNNKIKIFDKDSFIHHCSVFDGKAYDDELNRFKHIVDSLRVFYDRNQKSVVRKLKFLSDLSSTTDNYEIKKYYEYLETEAFMSVYKKFPTYYDSCFRNEDLPMAFRLDCIYNMMVKYAREGKVDRVLKMDEHYRKLSGTDRYPAGYQECMDSVKKFVTFNDSVLKLGLSEDTLRYLSAISYLTICRTSWNVFWPCYDCSMAFNRLIKFTREFPNSLLADNAEYMLRSSCPCNDEGGFNESDIKFYEQLLVKYPDTDIRADIEYEVFSLYLGHEDAYKKEFQAAARKFVKHFPYDRRAEFVRSFLNRAE